MAPSADDKKYSTDTRPWAAGVVADGIYPRWQDSPISKLLTMKDICIYKPGDLNKIGKEGKTSWDSFSYALLMAHNVWMHITAVQEANIRFESGDYPSMMRYSAPTRDRFEDIVESIFSAKTKEKSLEIIEKYSNYWMEIPGTRGFKGKKTLNANHFFNLNFEIESGDTDENDLDEGKLEALEVDQ